MMRDVVVAASSLEILLTVGGLVVVLAGVIAAQVWAQRRRNRGDEASTSNAAGAEALMRHPGFDD